MDCLETRKKLSSYADGELQPSEGRAEVEAHLAGCDACTQQLEEQGALDMLLKDHFKPVPPDGYEDRLVLSVEQRIDEDTAQGGGKGDEQELVFKSSPALQALNIPDRRPAEPSPVAAPVAATAAPAEPTPQATGGGYRWPVAFVLAAAVITGGFLIHKRMNPPAPLPGETATPTMGPAGGASAAAAPTSADATVLAQAGSMDGGAAEPATGADGGVDDNAAKSADKPQDKSPLSRKRRGKRSKKAAAKASPKPGTPEPAPAAAAVAKAPTAKKPGKPSSLDSLIDNAIGGRPKAAAPAKAAPAPDANLPDQLTMNQIRGGMRKIRSRVQACYDKYQVEGKATVKLTISKAGRIKETLIKGKFFGTDTGTCVAAAVKKAKFPKFKGNEMKISYPFILQ